MAERQVGERLSEQAKVYAAQCRGGVVLSTRYLADFIEALARQLAEAKAAATALNADVSALGRQLAEAERERDEVRKALSAYRSALRSGERESDQLREFGDAALHPPDPPASPAEGSEAATEVEA